MRRNTVHSVPGELLILSRRPVRNKCVTPTPRNIVPTANNKQWNSRQRHNKCVTPTPRSIVPTASNKQWNSRQRHSKRVKLMRRNTVRHTTACSLASQTHVGKRVRPVRRSCGSGEPGRPQNALKRHSKYGRMTRRNTGHTVHI
jgi:hypothetical protein